MEKCMWTGRAYNKTWNEQEERNHRAWEENTRDHGKRHGRWDMPWKNIGGDSQNETRKSMGGENLGMERNMEGEM